MMKRHTIRSLDQALHRQRQVRAPPHGRVPSLGNGRGGRHIIDLNPFHVLRNGHVDGLPHDAPGIPHLRDNDLLYGRVDDLLHSALLDALHCLGLGVDAPSLVGAVVRRRRYGAPDSEELVLSEGAQVALSATAGAGRAAWKHRRKRSLSSQTPTGSLIFFFFSNA